jgi:hypothetical protein
MKRYEAIDKAISSLKESNLQVLAQAVCATQRRLSQAPDIATHHRLQQRLLELPMIRSYFENTPGVTFLGMYGWGEGCHVSASSGEGISEYDSIVYIKNGKRCVEKIGSCWQLFQRGGRPVSVVADGLITPGGQCFSMEVSNPLHSPHVFSGDHGERRLPVESSSPWPLGAANGSLSEKGRLDVHGDLGSNREVLDVSEKKVPEAVSRPKRRLNKSIQAPVFNASEGMYCMTAEDFKKTQIPKSRPRCRDVNCSDSACDTAPLLVPDADDKLVIEGNEGCPCCLNAIDLDELAGLGRILNDTGESSHIAFELAEIDATWGLLAGLAGPFAMVGLVAAYRNVTGAYATRQVLKDKLAEIERLIDEEDTPQRQAYRYCLQYSLFDSNWNVAVPGALNGVSSSAVLSTLVMTSPLAIPALGAYAFAQAGRGIYETARSWESMTGYEKIDQITCSKRRFHMSNSTAFTCMGVGAALVAVSPLTLGATLIPGLCLLIPGTLASGVLNNIWPRKFRPRNGDLGVSRETLTMQTCERMITKIRAEKSEIKAFKQKYVTDSGSLRVRRFCAKLMAVLPFCEKRAGTWLHALTKEQMKVSLPAMTMHESELWARLGREPEAGMTVTDLVTGHLKSLRYQQYGLVDFYWGLRRFES